MLEQRAHRPRATAARAASSLSAMSAIISVLRSYRSVILPGHNRRFPGDHAKWVERPHGHATVSGERRLYAHVTASLTDVGRQEPPLRSASQDTWALGRPYSPWRRERRQRRAHVPLPFVFLFLHSFFSSLPIAAHAQSAPAQTVPTIRESVVVTATGREMPESKVGASITVLDREQIEQRHALSTIDLLRTVPGIVAVRDGRRRQSDRRVRARR